MKYFIVICIVLSTCTLRAQQQVYLNIDVGDEIPEIHLQDIHDRSEPTVELRALSQSKLVIIDFWATWCGACLGAMPKMDSIGREYADALEIFTVTYESKELVLEFLKKRQGYGQYVHQAPKVFGDTVLYKLFPHQFIPHYVWIKEGKVMALTEKVTREAVAMALSEGKTNLPKKVDVHTVSLHETGQSLIQYLQNDNGLNMEVVDGYSIFTGYVDGVSGGMSGGTMDSVGKRRLTLANMALVHFYKAAYGKQRTFIIDPMFEIRSTDSLFSHKGLKGMEALDWVKKYGVSYEVVADADKDIHEKMAADLKHEFPQFHAFIENTRDTCLVLEEFDAHPEVTWKVDNDEPADYSRNQDCMLIKNGTIEALRTFFEGFILFDAEYPIVSEVAYGGKIDIALCGRLGSVDDINRELQKYGLRLTKKPAWYDKLIIEDSI